jgi:hypothetical protein
MEQTNMTKLLATIEQADALHYARDLIVRLHGREGGSPFESAESRRFVRDLMHACINFPRGRMFLIDAALAGEAEAQHLLSDAILDHVSARREMPTELAYYSEKLALRQVPDPVASPGPDKRNEFTRNVIISVVICALRDRFHMKPTGRSARRRNACAVVGQALAVVGHGIGPKAVEAIWSLYGRGMPTVPGWTDILD